MRHRMGVCVLAGFIAASTAFADAPPATEPTTQPTTQAASSNDMLTAQEIRQLVDSGQFRDGLKALSRVLQLKGPAAGDYDLHEMLMLKAECLLQTRQNKEAIDTLKIASAGALKDANDEHGAEANALIQLIQKSPGDMYTPKTAVIKKPIPILDRTLRKDAYLALFNDLLVVFTAQTKTALGSMNLQLTLDAANAAIGIRAVERVATGSNKQSEDVMNKLATHAVKMINAVLDAMASRTRQIGDRANQVITAEVTQTDGSGRQYQTQQSYRRGLSNGDRDTLNEVITDCTKLPAACETLAKALAQQQDELHIAALKAVNVDKDATSILNDNYAGAVNQGNPQPILPGQISNQPNH